MMKTLAFEQFDVIDEKSLTEINGGDAVSQCLAGIAAFGLLGGSIFFCGGEAY